MTSVVGLGARLQVAAAGPELAEVCVRSKRYGYGSVPAARSASTWARRRARSAARPLPVAASAAASSVKVSSATVAAR